MISSGRASLRLWHQLYFRVFICKHSVVIPWFWVIKSTRVYYLAQHGRYAASYSSAKQTDYQQPSSQFHDSWHLEYGITYLLHCYNELENGLSSSHTSLPRFDWPIATALMTTFTSHGKQSTMWCLSMCIYARSCTNKYIHCFQVLVYSVMVYCLH